MDVGREDMKIVDGEKKTQRTGKKMGEKTTENKNNTLTEKHWHLIGWH